jgi:hypothetical protein
VHICVPQIPRVQAPPEHRPVVLLRVNDDFGILLRKELRIESPETILRKAEECIGAQLQQLADYTFARIRSRTDCGCTTQAWGSRT